MSVFRLVWSSLLFHARIHGAVALGVIVATAVLTGALLVGDSMRGSLKHLTLDRLGRIDELLVVDRFFRTELASEVAGSEPFQESDYAEVAPAILLASTSLESQQQEGARASGVLALGITEAFWTLDPRGEPLELTAEEIILNEPLARELNVKEGDLVVLRLPSADQVPADSPLGRKDNLVRSVPELKVKKILPAEGLGRFALRPNQSLPRNAYVALQTLQDALEQPDRANALFVAGKTIDPPPPLQASEKVQAALRPTLADYGLKLRRVTRKWRDEVVYDYFELSSDRMLIEPEVAASAQKAFAMEKPQVLFTYLANRIERVPQNEEEQAAQKKRGPISYSTITAVDSDMTQGPALGADGKVIPLADDEILLNDWAAKDQEAKPGDSIKISYFEPETTHGNEQETSTILKLRDIVPLPIPTETGEDDPRPTLASDPNLTPEVKGVTDAESISRWDAPFPVDYSIVRQTDDAYWEKYRTTPKAFVSLATGQKLWGSRWGEVTAVRFVASESMSQAELEQRLLQQLRDDNVTLGFEFQPIKRRDLAASSGTTPFDALFLGLSFFIVAAALLLVVLLFRLGVEQRASEIGLLLGLGWTRQKTTWWLIGEGTIVAAIGALLGVLAGVGYAWLMLVGLRTWWLGAIATPFLQMYVTPQSLIIGYLGGVLVSLAAIWWGTRQLRRVTIRRLLSGQAIDELAPAATTRSALNRWIAAGLIVIAVGLAFVASRLQAEAQAGAFLGSGAAVLAALLLIVREQLRGGAEGVGLLGRGALGRLALRSAARNPSRSLLTLALVGSAGFLIVALSAFRLDPTKSGSGGFAYVAESAQPVLIDLNDPDEREQLLADDATLLEGSTLLPFRLQPGDDASCRNLYQPTQPRVLGVTSDVVKYYDDPAHEGFAWSMSAAKTEEERHNPWRLLAEAHPADEPVPVVIDQNTAMYSLKLLSGMGQEFTIEYPGGQTVTFRVAGLLSNSVLQGSLLIGEADFKRLFPQNSGYRFFLIQPGNAEQGDAAIAALERGLSDQGLDVKRSRDILEDLMAVQNTYLSTFQTLGALGLVLGTFGVAAVQLRSVLERRGELGLLRAAGFRKARLAELVMLENIVLLLGGLVLGIVAALIAVLPHFLVGGARPPLTELALMLGLVAVVGCLVGLLSVRSVLRAPVIAALRGE